MARNTRRRAARQKGEKALDIINSVAEDREDGDDSRATNFERRIDTELVDHEHVDEQRQLRRSARNKRTAHGMEGRFSPLFVPQDEPQGKTKEAADKDINGSEEADELESEADDAADAEISEAEEAGEDEEDREVEEDGDSVDSEDDFSMSDQQQLLQEQEQAIVNSQQEQQEEEREQVLVNSPVLVVIDRSKERVSKERKNAATAKAAAPETARAKADHAHFLGEDGEFEDSESEQEDENVDGAGSELDYEDDEEVPSDDSFDMDDTQHDAGTALKSLFDWGDEQPAEPVQGSRTNDQLETQSPRPRESSSRKRRRASNTSTDEPNRSRRRIDLQNQNQVAARRSTPFALPADLEATTSPEMHDRTRRRMETPNQGIERAPRRRPPVARDSPEVADWEATILEKENQDDVIIVGESMSYDDATKIQDLQVTWKRLIKYCQKLKDNGVRRMRRYVGIEAIVERISDLLKDYKMMQRKRSRGRPIDAITWKRTRQEVNYISEDAAKIRNVLVRRAKEGKESNDLQTQADAVEYAELIVQHVMTSLCELALECLKTYYSVEDKWLLNGGFGAVLDIIDIVGELDLTLTSLHNCAMVMLSPYPGRPIRQELRSIRGSLARAEADEQRRER
ncbi:uncharacterized protein BHQ10_002404 [Talaromyces amestolkiae]|uniref:Uncharacterized protein n=1 Tax=Talaromyces amestolkiae TaxID=1196081 RepID=A0A364KS58_TALAM|nr:uncharacterized protein BHQ10_002404 [Talaromyces amestolkiae]RAO66392.1 hypothetical protein BHQ10_002404 [Talaromyces amestolkiae]